jgi:hypothetical protein
MEHVRRNVALAWVVLFTAGCVPLGLAASGTLEPSGVSLVGVVDVVLAASVVVLGGVWVQRGPVNQRWVRNSYRVLCLVLPLVVVATWLAWPHVVPDVLMPGLAWRLWLLSLLLPHLLTAVAPATGVEIAAVCDQPTDYP